MTLPPTLATLRSHLECIEALQAVKAELTIGDYEIDFGMEKTIERKAFDLFLVVEAAERLATIQEMMEVLGRLLMCRAKVCENVEGESLVVVVVGGGVGGGVWEV